tara:strand:- start:4481 stop:5209 length:729 start_codon:yes stop_codon:yes gene_type:complete
VANNFESIILEKKSSILTITLNRPDILNAYNIQMRDEMWQALLAIKDDLEVKVIILKGAGEKAFCAGADLTEFTTAPSQTIARQVRRLRPIWELWASIRKPFICALHGYVIGSGLEMALLCDIRIASPEVKIRLPEVALGMLPAAGGSQTLTKLTGISTASKMLLTTNTISANEALQMGIISKIIKASELQSEVEHIAEHIAGININNTQSLLNLVKTGNDISLSQGLELEKNVNLKNSKHF